MHLKVVKVASDPPHVSDHHVPIFIVDQNVFREQLWDLTTQQVIYNTIILHGLYRMNVAQFTVGFFTDFELGVGGFALKIFV